MKLKKRYDVRTQATLHFPLNHILCAVSIVKCLVLFGLYEGWTSAAGCAMPQPS